MYLKSPIDFYLKYSGSERISGLLKLLKRYSERFLCGTVPKIG